MNLRPPGYEKSLDIGDHPDGPNSVPLGFVFSFWSRIFVPTHHPRCNANWGQIGVKFVSLIVLRVNEPHSGFETLTVQSHFRLTVITPCCHFYKWSDSFTPTPPWLEVCS